MQHTTIKTFEDACKALNVDATILNVENVPTKHQAALAAHYKLVIIAEALNGGWQPNWKNHSERKYMPWFDVISSDENGSGLGLSFIGVGNWNTITNIGSRLCFKSRELAEYAGKQFEDIYKQFLIIQ